MIILCESLGERRMIIDLRRLETLYINDENLISNTNIEHRQILTKIGAYNIISIQSRV